MDLIRYDKWYSTHNNNIITNPIIVEKNIIKYFDVKGPVVIEKIDNELGIVIFSQDDKKWWDYFMDVNPMVISSLIN